MPLMTLARRALVVEAAGRLQSVGYIMVGMAVVAMALVRWYREVAIVLILPISEAALASRLVAWAVE